MATPEQMAWLKSMVPFAQTSAAKFKVPASVTLAQCITESSWGASKLAVNCHNYFGVKAAQHATPGTYQEFPTIEYEEGRKVLVQALFAKYATVQESFDAHAMLLADNPRYRSAMVSAAHAKAFAVALQHCGYSTNANYARDLMALMRDYNLTQYDAAAPTPPAKEIA
jgi:flagellum-specific peptidoglycan hydrolase FlgJ